MPPAETNKSGVGLSDDERLWLRDEFFVEVLGEKLKVRRLRGENYPRIGWLRGRYFIVNGMWKIWKAGMRELFEQAILEWKGLTYEDLWRDPEIALDLYRRITASGGR